MYVIKTYVIRIYEQKYAVIFHSEKKKKDKNIRQLHLFFIDFFLSE